MARQSALTDEHIEVFGQVLGQMTHELDGLSWRLAITKEKLAGLVPMVINTLYEELLVSFKVPEMGPLGRTIPIRNMVRELVPLRTCCCHSSLRAFVGSMS